MLYTVYQSKQTGGEWVMGVAEGKVVSMIMMTTLPPPTTSWMRGSGIRYPYRKFGPDFEYGLVSHGLLE